MSCNGNRATEMSFQRVHAADVIRMQVRNDYRANLATFGDHVVETLSQRLLLVFVRRTGIHYENLFRRVNQVAARVRCGRTRRRAHWKADVVWPERDTACDFALRVPE